MLEAYQNDESAPKLQCETDGPGGPPGQRPKTAVGANNENPYSGLDVVRHRPSMYIGSTGSRGLHYLVWEILGNSADEALGGHCTEIEVTINEDSSITVEDNGRGIPTDVDPRTGKSTLETVFTVLHAGGKCIDGRDKASGGLYGTGAAVVNALSEKLEVIVSRDGKLYKQSFERGNPITKLDVLGETAKRATKVTFCPDSIIFHESYGGGESTSIKFEWNVLTERLREMAFSNKGVTFRLKDLRNEGKAAIISY